MNTPRSRSSEQTGFRWLILSLSLAMAGTVLLDQEVFAAVSTAREVDRAVLDEKFGKLPLGFETNQGQTDDAVRFLARGNGFTIFLTPSEAVLAFHKTGAIDSQRVSFKFSNGDPKVSVVGRDLLPGKVHYLVGNDPDCWHRDIPSYARVQFQQVRPGVDLVYYGNQRQIECDFVVAPGASPSSATFDITGVSGLEKDGSGDIILQLPDGSIHLTKPVAYQVIDGVKHEVACGFELREGHRVGFQVADYDSTRTLIIDPVLGYSTYLGGIGMDAGKSIAVDADGNAYVTGVTSSSDFEAPKGMFDRSLNGPTDAFVTKIDSSGSNVVYSTYLGGDGNESGLGIVVDQVNDAFVVGVTDSTDFPKTEGTYQRSAQGGLDAFVAKLTVDGSDLVYATYLGGSGDDQANGIVIDEVGFAYVVGTTRSTDFPVTSGAYRRSLKGSSDAFVTELNPTATDLIYSTYLGGNNAESGNAIALNDAGNAFVTGQTTSTDFPKTNGAKDGSLGGATDAFVTKVGADGTDLVFSTYLGGEGNEVGTGIAVDDADQPYVTGQTDSYDFPDTSGAYDRSFHKVTDAFVTAYNADGSGYLYSTFLGGSGADTGVGIAVDADRNAHVVGVTTSRDFPTTPNAPDRSLQSGNDIFVTKISAGGSNLLYSTYLGGKGNDTAAAIALDALGNDYITGVTDGTDFPTTKGAHQRDLKALTDAFIAKIAVVSGPIHDMAVSNISIPKKIKLSEKKPSVDEEIEVEIQNRSQHDEIINDMETLANLVTLSITSLGECANPVPVLKSASSSLPVELSPGQTLEITYTVTINCVNDPLKSSKKNPGHEDYNVTATVHHSALDGAPDDHTADDTCPHDALPGGVDPYPDGKITDNGCGAKKEDKTYGGPLLLDVQKK